MYESTNLELNPYFESIITTKDNYFIADNKILRPYP